MHKIVKYNISDLSKITCMADFYKVTGISKLLESKEIIDVEQIHMNKENCEKLDDICKTNYKLRDKKFKHLSKTSWERAVAMDWLNYSPVCHEDMPNDEIWIFPYGTDWRNWFKENKNAVQI